ncbi:unnamed protein product [Symbiodinium sp. CCMP2592]|nr:unnamed protein product [Symbiodinium sp. CCMP2592]
MSRRRGAFSAFEKTASQAAAASQSSQPDVPRESSIQVGAARVRRGPPKSLSVHEAKTLLESLRSASTHTDFQKALVNLRGRGWGALKKREAVARLLGMAWKAPLKAAGFSIDQWGFPEMLAAIRVHHAQPGIKTLSEEIERQLRFQPGDLFGSKAGAMKQTSSAAEAAAVTEAEVQVTVTHPTDRDSVVVSVPGSANMRQVKDALARKLGRPEVARNGRMVVESPTGDLLPVPDSQRLGMKRQVFIMGTSLATTPAAGSFASQPAAKPQQASEPKPTRDRALNLGEAKELLKAFREIASAKDFQKTLGNIHKQGPEAVQRMQPMFVGQSFNRTMAMYDFPLTTEGYQDMARGISKHSWNIHVKAQAHEVERLLRMPPGAFFGIPGEPGQEQDFPPLPAEETSKTPAKVPPRQEPLPPKAKSRQGIEVLARHAVDNAEVRVALPHDATFFDCKQAISKFLGRDEILRKGRLVQKKGGVYSTYKDDDPIGDVRQVLVLGADLRTVEDQEDDQPPPIHPYAAQPQTPVQSPNEGSRAGVDSYSVSRRHEGLEPPPRAKESAYPSADPHPAPPKPPEPKPTPKKAAPPPKPKPPPPAQQYEIRIRHAVEAGPEITLTIYTNWTFDAVREALAKKLGRDDIRRKARFVFKASAGTSPWIAFKDQETVGWAPDGSRRNELMMLGVELDDTEPLETALPLDSMKRLLQELENACAQDDLQVQLEKLHDRGGIALQLGITQLMGQAVQKATELVLGRAWKLQRVIDAVKVHSSDQSVRSLAEGVERRLRLEPGMLFSRPQDPKDARSSNRAPMGRSAMEELEHVESNDEPAGLPELSVQQVIAMQRELHAGFSDPAFQRRLDILENFHAKDPKLIPMRQELFLSVQSKVLPKYGFQGSLKGVFDMLEVFRRPDLQHNGEFVRLGSELNSLLRLMPDGRPRPTKREAFPEPAATTQAAGKAKPKPKTPTPPVERQQVPVRDIEVIIRHAVPEGSLANEEVLLTVKSNATMKSIKEALVAHLGKPELLRSCRLVQPVGENGAFSSFKDNEKLNGRRALLVLGIPSLRPAGEEPAEDVPAEKGLQASLEPRSKPEAKVATPQPPKLSISQALALQRDLLQGFSDPEFQQKRKELVAALRQSEPRKFSAERQKLFLTVQKVVLPRYGFEGSPKGVFDMLQQFDRPEITSNAEFQQQGAVLNHLLFAEDPAEAIPATAQAFPEPEVSGRSKKSRGPPARQQAVHDIEVAVRHAVQEGPHANEEALLTVKSNATMKSVKEALVAHLGKPELLRSCRLVQPVGENGAFSSFKDNEKLNGRRALLVLGITSLRPAGEEPAEDVPAEKGLQASLEPRSKPEAKVAAPEPPKLSISQTLALQRDLLQGFSDPEFQQKRKELVAALRQSEPRRFSAERQKLFLTVQKVVLPRYGFEGSPKGVFDMLQQFDRPEITSNAEFQQQGAVLNHLLFAEDPAEAIPATAQAFPEPEVSGRSKKSRGPPARQQAVHDIEVAVRHAVQEGPHANEEALLTVKSNATMKSVKEALVAHLGKPELLRSCRLVQPVGENGAFSSFKDNEKLNGRRALLVLGITSLRPAGEEPAEDVPAEKGLQASLEPRSKPEAKVAAPQPPKLSISQALALQHLGRRDLLQGFSDPEFQQKRKDQRSAIVQDVQMSHTMSRDGGIGSHTVADGRPEAVARQSEPRKFSAERQKLFLTVQKVVLPRYGFEGSPKAVAVIAPWQSHSWSLQGVFDMLQQFDRPEITSNAEFQQQGAVLNHLLFAEDPAEAIPATAQAFPEPEAVSSLDCTVFRDLRMRSLRGVGSGPTNFVTILSDDRLVEVAVRHAVQEALLTVKSNATMKSVKALVAHLGKPELLRSCRLVQPVGENGAFSSFKDNEKLNGRRALLVLGITSLRPAGEEPAEDVPAEKGLQASLEPRSKPEAKVAAPQPPKLSISQALALQHLGRRDLLQGFSDPEFQQKRKDQCSAIVQDVQMSHAMSRDGGIGSHTVADGRPEAVARQSEPRKFSAERQKLFLTVQKVVLPRYGFEGSPKGVFDMLQQFDRPEISSNPELLQQGAVLNDLLFGEMGAPVALQPQAETQSKAKTRAPPPSRTAAPVREVEVVVRHAVQEDHPANEEALLTMKSNATMKSVKEALVAHLGKPELLRSCRLVQPVGENGAFSSFKDNEKLNGRRALLVLGIPSLRPAGEEPAEDVPAEKGLQASPEPRVKPEAKVAAPEPPKLSISQTLALQRDLLQGFSDPEFQQKRKDQCSAIVQSEPRKFSAERQKLFLTVQKVVLPRYGFEGSPKAVADIAPWQSHSCSLQGVFDMLQQFDRPEITSNAEFQQQGAVLNHLLFAEEMAEPAEAAASAMQAETQSKAKTRAPPPSRTAAPVRDVEVVVRHAVQEDHPANEEALLTVKSNATMKSVKEALVAHLGKPELLRSCRLVQPVGENGAFSSFKDNEKLNGRRALLVLGIPSLRPAGEEPAEDVPAEKGLQASLEPRSKPEAKVAAPQPPKLSISQALALQRDLLQGFSDPEFQQKRKELVAALRQSAPRKFSVERQKLFLTVQKVVLPRYGFEGSPKGVFDMLQQFDRPEITSNAEFQQQGAVLNELLFAEEVAAPGSQDSVEELNATKEVQVRVRRAGDSVTSEEVYVTVASTASMRDVRAAVAEKCNNPAFLQRAKLVRNRGGVLVGYQDSEPIRGRRRLLFLGPSLWRDGDVGDEAPSAGDSDSEEADGAAPGTLSLEKARRFLHRVKDACASQSFQQSVAELRARARQRGETTGTRMAVGTLFIAACQSILRKFGFGIDRQGYEQMFTAIFPHGQDPTILALASEIEKLLGVPVGSWFGLSNDAIQDGSGQLSRDEARQVVTEIRRLVGSPTFQKEVAAIRDRVRSRNGSLQEVSQEVYMPFYRLVRPITLAFRLGGDPQCLSRMSAALAPHMEDAQLRSAVRQVETSFLHTHPGAFFATSQDAPQGSLEASASVSLC